MTESKILLLVLGAGLFSMAGEYFLQRKRGGEIRLKFFAAGIAIVAAAVGYFLAKSPAFALWPAFIAVSAAFGAAKKRDMLFTFSFLTGALASAMSLGSMLYSPRSAAVLYPLGLSAFLLFAGFSDGALRYFIGPESGSRKYAWQILIVFGILGTIFLLPATKWFFISGWQAVILATLIGIGASTAVKGFENFPVSPAAYALLAAAFGIFIAYLASGIYSAAIAAIVFLIWRSVLYYEEERLTPGQQMLFLAPDISSAIFLMLLAYGRGFSQRFPLFDWREPLILLFATAVLVLILSIKKLRAETTSTPPQFYEAD